MRVTSGMTQRAVLADLNRVSERVTRMQTKASSNREITRPSDDPYNAARAIQLRESLAGTQQLQRNIENAQGWQEVSESALSNITDAIHRAQELLVQGSSDTSDPAARESIAGEIDELIASVKQSANASYQGRYVFAGTQTDQPPYLEGADDGYKGVTTVVERQVGPGIPLQIGVTADTFLGSGGGDRMLLDTLRDTAANLRAGNGPGMEADLERLDRNLDELLGVRAFNGARQNRLDAALSRMAQVEEATMSQLSETEDADIAKTLIELTSQQTAYQAALKAGANIMQASLMDFLR
jgi:flagellar hook-associated protein 3 FlgL